MHSAQFAGFYAADQNGDYAAEGLAVTFIEGVLMLTGKRQCSRGRLNLASAAGLN